MRLPLVVQQGRGSLLPYRGMSDPGVTVWRDARGVAWGHGYADAMGYWMLVHEAGSFRYDPQAGVVVAHPRAGISGGRLQDVYERAVLPLVLQALGLEVLHASAVRLGRGVVGLCGASRVGKSTMAYALSRRGHRPCADDALALDLGRAEPRVIPLPFQVRPRAGVGASREAGAVQGAAAPDHGVDGDAVLEPSSLTALFVLTRTVNADIGLAPLPPAAAFSAVLPHAYCFSVENESRKRRMVAAYCRLASSVPVFEIAFGPGLERLPTILDAIERSVARVDTRAA